MKPSTEAALHASVFRAARLLEERIDHPPAIAELAREAGISPFHFQRAFKSVVGETVAQHSQRLRLERAASFLKFSAWQIQEIGLAAGFNDAPAFGRAFKKLYGCTPQQFRNQQSVVPFLRGWMRSGKPHETAPNSYPTPTAKVETWPDITVVAIRHYGTVQSIHQPWKALLNWTRTHHPDPQSARYFGLWFDDWSNAPVDDPRYRYEAAVTLPGGWEGTPDAPFHLRTLPSGPVATAHAFGSIPALDRAWRSFAYGWLPYSGYQPRGDFGLDEYDPSFILSSPLKKILSGFTGLPLKMCLPIQQERMSV